LTEEDLQITEGYKLFMILGPDSKYDLQSEYWSGLHLEGLPKRRWLQANDIHLRDAYDLNYKGGWHSFINRDKAIVYLKGVQSHSRDNEYHLHRVLIKDIRAIGTHVCGDVVVSGQIFIMEEISGE